MLDPQIELVKSRTWEDYVWGRTGTAEHLAALNTVYDGLVSSHRDAISVSGDLDPVTEDLLIRPA